MRIVNIKATPISVPFVEREMFSFGYREGLSNVIIEIETDGGITGIGECMGNPSAGAILEAIKLFRPHLLGRDVFSIEAITIDFYKKARWAYFRNLGNSALAGVEMALWDIIGKLTKQPVYRLLGGKVRDEISFFTWIQRKDINSMVKEAQEAVEKGARTLYLKVGFDPKEDVRMVADIRAAVGDNVNIRLDPNEAWNEGLAKVMINQLEKYDIELVEQPISRLQVDALTRLRKSTRVRIAADQAAWIAEDCMDILSRKACDVLITDAHRVGGLLALKKVAAACQMADVPFCRHSQPELGISLAAGIHVMATIPNLTDGNQTYASLLADDIVEEKMKPDVEKMNVIEEPGLGVHLNRDKLNRYAELYHEKGEFTIIS